MYEIFNVILKFFLMVICIFFGIFCGIGVFDFKLFVIEFVFIWFKYREEIWVIKVEIDLNIKFYCNVKYK